MSRAPGPVVDALLQAGLLLDFGARAVAATASVLARARLAWRECLHQVHFLAAVTTLPSLLVTIPLGVVAYCLTFTPDGKAIVTGHDRKRGTEEYTCRITPLS